MGLRIFFGNRNEFLTHTENEIDLEYSCKIGVGIRIFRPGKAERKEKLDLE